MIFKESDKFKLETHKAVGDIFTELDELDKLQSNVPEESGRKREASILNGGFFTIRCC